MPGLGDEFRAAREARQLSLSDVSERIHIRSLYLQHLEDGDPSFAAPVYVRGFLRTYARFLGLDPEAAVARFNLSFRDAHKAHDPIVAPRSSGTRAASLDTRAASPWLWLAGLAAAVLVGFVGYRYFELQGASDAPVVGSVFATPVAARIGHAAVSAAPVAEPSDAADSKRTLSVHLTRDSWVSVKIDGSSVLEGVLKAGSTKSFHGKTADVRAGNAGGVDVTVNGKELGRMGNVGDVVERNFVLAAEE